MKVEINEIEKRKTIKEVVETKANSKRSLISQSLVKLTKINRTNSSTNLNFIT